MKQIALSYWAFFCIPFVVNRTEGSEKTTVALHVHATSLQQPLICLTHAAFS